MVGVASVIGVKEPFYAVKEAILMGIRQTGHKPAIIHCDRGPAWKELEAWCEANDIKLYPSIVGNARAKTIENMFYQFDNDITRFLSGYSGQNRTALSVNSHASEKREKAGKHNARSAAVAMEWLKTEGMQLWNERIIKTLERKPCGKSPMQLWNEKESYTPELPYTQLCVICGTLHEVKLTVNGLDLSHKTKDYTYFPLIETQEQREKAQQIFSEIPRQANTANKCKIYILTGGKSAPVFDHNGKFLGVWECKKNAAFIAETKEEKEVVGNYIALQQRILENAKETNLKIKQTAERSPDFERLEQLGNEPLTGKRIAGRYDKSECLVEEIEAKAAEKWVSTQEYKELVDPDTGEIIYVRKSALLNQ
jgi:hypothetical protein